MRIAGISIPTDKRLIISLQYIYGIGLKKASEICKVSKLKEDIRVKDLTTEQEELLRKVLSKLEYVLESDLRRQVSQNVKRLQDIGSYRGFRHRKRLPVRGQRTKTNARTKRGGKIQIANKKKVAK